MKRLIMIMMALTILSSCGLRFGDYNAYKKHNAKRTCN